MARHEEAETGLHVCSTLHVHDDGIEVQMEHVQGAHPCC